MSVKRIVLGGCAALLLATATPALADNARLPYHLLYNAQKAEGELNQVHTNLLIVLTMQSTLPDVAAGNFVVYIDSKSGRIPITLRESGDFTIPLRENLLAEDPWIITNQPKGTVKLNLQIGLLPGRLVKTMHYARLMRAVRESEDVQDQMRRYFPGAPRLNAIGLRLGFTAAQKASVIIHARGGDRKLTTNDHGEIILPLSEDLLAEDPELSLTALPSAVEIVSRARE